MLHRRAFLSRLISGIPAVAAAAFPGVALARSRLLIQESPVAGFQYHQGMALWAAFSVGDPLTLEREPDNPHDARAVTVRWGQFVIGYLPRAENCAVSQMLARGATLRAASCGFKTTPTPGTACACRLSTQESEAGGG